MKILYHRYSTTSRFWTEKTNKTITNFAMDFPFDLHDGHIMTQIDGCEVLVDTGAPASAGVRPLTEPPTAGDDGALSAVLSLCGGKGDKGRKKQGKMELRIGENSYALGDNYQGVRPEKLSEFIGRKVDVLLGMDVLARYTFVVDPDRGRLSLLPPNAVTEQPAGRKRVVLPVRGLMGLPVVTVSVPGDAAGGGARQVPVFFDTGAKLGYLDPKVSHKFPVRGERPDFHPSCGRYSTTVRSVPVTLGDEGTSVTIEMEMGELPPHLAAIRSLGILGIVGTAVLEAHGIVLANDRLELFQRVLQG
eukprot:TRINITY_DN13490_c0_g1_i1.p1 TRINITY_DN13490_c0_g1~~TRINITY_DN13490_c0_g1_i1.p1  ORF type:complete len:304 (+),score=44.83 TRINITY_DN13490_c0_g1_i1:106-1017(+)